MKPLFIIILALAAAGCSDTKECKDTLCTAMFAMVNVQLTDTANPQLTSITTQTLLLSSGKIIHTQTQPSDIPTGIFMVVDDTDIIELGFKTSQKVELKIHKNGTLIKTVPYTITTDCCHVSKTEGPTEVSLN